MATDKIHIGNYTNTFDTVLLSSKIGDASILTGIRDFVKDRVKELKVKTGAGNQPIWNDFKSFWPPRLLTAYKSDNLIGFFGAGISIPSGLPSWNSLLTNYLKLDDKYTNDKELESDPLTLAEIASNFIGSENLQDILRSEFSKTGIYPVTNHYVLASLRLPVYITTNYDELFEVAWKIINPNIQLKVIVNDIDLANEYVGTHMSNPQQDVSYLFKIHGCTTRRDEQLILTRKDYRLHYRSNEHYFNQIRLFLKTSHILFVGFSHKDIEVTRLVEDAIYGYEKDINSGLITNQPNFYSLQFDMRSHTPEIFAAKGIVALEPPVTTLIGDFRSVALNTALTELYLADQFELDSSVSFENDLDRLKASFENVLSGALITINFYYNDALNSISTKTNYAWLTNLLASLGDLANEGVYLCDEQGRILEYELPKRYSKTSRAVPASTIFIDRPYFRQAKTFRTPFISDSFKSIYNENSTFTVCLPIFENTRFKGLLFSACQIGSWQMPLNEANAIWNANTSLSFILIDSNGNCLIPPNNDFALTNNEGYNFDKLFLLSKKDKVISRLIENVLPINKDDDVINISSNIKYYSLITELKKTRWKIGIATPIILNN